MKEVAGRTLLPNTLQFRCASGSLNCWSDTLRPYKVEGGHVKHLTIEAREDAVKYAASDRFRDLLPVLITETVPVAVVKMVDGVVMVCDLDEDGQEVNCRAYGEPKE